MQLSSLDLQDNVIGGYGVSRELQGVYDLCDAMLMHCKEKSSTASLYLSGNAIQPAIGSNLKESHMNSLLQLHVDVRTAQRVK